MARHPRRIKGGRDARRARNRPMTHLNRNRHLVRPESLVLGDAGVACQYNGDAALFCTGVFERVQESAVKAGQVVRIGMHR